MRLLNTGVSKLSGLKCEYLPCIVSVCFLYFDCEKYLFAVIYLFFRNYSTFFPGFHLQIISVLPKGSWV